MHGVTTQQIDQSVAEVFALMLDLPCTPAGQMRLTGPSLVASVTFSGCLRGACAIGLERDTAGWLTGRLLGLPAESLAGEDALVLLADTVSELCNMIAGGWKRRLREDVCCSLAPSELRDIQLPAAPGRGIYRCYALAQSCLAVVELTIESP